MTQEARRQPRAAARLQRCVYFRELFLRGRQRAAKLKQSHRVIIFSPVCYGLVRNALSRSLSSSPGIKMQEQCERRRNGRGPEESARCSVHIIIESDTRIIMISLFHLLQLGYVIVELDEEATAG